MWKGKVWVTWDVTIQMNKVIYDFYEILGALL